MNFVSVLVALALVAPGQLGAVKTSVTDAAITTRIETTFLLNEHLSAFEINTGTQGGIVTLRGGVETGIQKDLAEELAASVGGVSQVNNQLTIVPDVKHIGPKRTFRTKVEDRTITASVRIRLLNSAHLGGLKIQAKTENSVVSLTGLVRTEFQREKVEFITYQTKGVERVVNHLTLSAREELSRTQNVIRQISDEVLEKRLESSIVMNRNLSVRTIDVEVDDGVAHLTGIVNSQPEKELATVIAETTRGIKGVDNTLTVQGAPAAPRPSTSNNLELLEPMEERPTIEPFQATPTPTPTPTPPPTPSESAGILEGNAPLFP